MILEKKECSKQAVVVLSKVCLGGGRGVLLVAVYSSPFTWPQTCNSCRENLVMHGSLQ